MPRFFINGQKIDLDKVAKEANAKSKNVKPKERREVFSGDSLEIMGLYANVEVQPSRKEKISILATGPAELVDQLKVTEHKGTVSISGSRSEGINIAGGGNVVGGNIIMGNFIGGNISNIGNDMTIIAGDDVIINTSDNASAKLSLKITAPLYTEVSIAGVVGNIVIGDLQGDVDLDMSGQNSARITNVRHLDLEMSGQCEATVEQINGYATLDVSGNSKVKLCAGYAEKLSIDVSGMSTVDARITAKNANLDASGMSSIRVQDVISRCREDTSGMSSITIG